MTAQLCVAVQMVDLVSMMPAKNMSRVVAFACRTHHLPCHVSSIRVSYGRVSRALVDQ